MAADGRDDLTDATTAKLAVRSRRLLADLLRPHRRVLRLLGIAVVIENAARLSIPLLVAKGIDVGIPPIRDHDDVRPLVEIVAIVLARDDHPGDLAQHLPGALGQDRPGHPLRDPAAGLPPLPAAQPGVPRLLHLGPGDLPADLRHRRDLRDARDRLRRADHRRPDPGRHRRPAALPRRQAGPGRAGVRAVPGLVDQLVPQGVGQELPRHPREGRAGHRPLRGVDERHPGRPGLPARAAQPGDLRRRQRPVPRGQPGRLPAGGLVHARRSG